MMNLDYWIMKQIYDIKVQNNETWIMCENEIKFFT